MKTKFYWSFIFIMLIVALGFTVFIAVTWYYIFVNEGKDMMFYFSLLIGVIGLYILYVFASGFMSLFPTLTLSKKGIAVKYFFGLGPTNFYPWENVEGYQTNDIEFMPHVNFLKYAVYANGKKIAVFNDFFYYNMDELEKQLSNYSERK